MRIILFALLSGLACLAQTGRVAVIVPPAADAVEKFAATELARYLGKLYPGSSFTLVGKPLAGAPAILVGTPRTHPALARYVDKEKLSTPESFVITHNGSTGIVAGADARGTLFGVYALLEKLGCGFYLSYDAAPAPRKEPFGFNDWQLADAPVYADRIVFDWHNFLSSASSWELEDWQRYIDQSAKMRFNTIMVHAYGNNPMFAYQFNGKWKPVGYLATTKSGRDWGTQHVNDVRRLIGGEVFRDPVFGAGVAKVSEDQRVPAAMGLMKKVFTHAASRGMHVTFALDVDTESANPQDIIGTLPASARIKAGKFELANPDTPEGYAFYKAQTQQLLTAYPEIDRLAVWFRSRGTPWRNIRLEDFPPEWKREFAAASGDNPSMRKDPGAPSIFAVAKLVRAFGKALHETGHGNVELATGSWNLEFLKAADHFMPREATVIPLDWSTVFDTAQGQKQLREVRSGRKLLPIVWAHHDDRTYIGRCYTPFVNFSTLLKSAGGSGFGIIHWTTRPLDLYFKSLGTQVWRATENQSVHETCDLMAARSFGESARTLGGEYLLSWVTAGPMFGRETSDRFMDVPLKDPEATMAKCRARLKLLAQMEGNETLAYFRDYEQFTLAFYECQLAYERAEDFLKKGDIGKAKREILKCKPEEVIGSYARAVRHGRISRGEEALLVSLNLRWRPYILSLRQALGIDPIRIKFGPTQHEPLAQGAGSNTFFVDEEHLFWKVIGEKAPEFHLAPIGRHKLPAGRYEVQLRFSDGTQKTETIESKNGAIDITAAGRKLAAAVVKTGN